MDRSLSRIRTHQCALKLLMLGLLGLASFVFAGGSSKSFYVLDVFDEEEVCEQTLSDTGIFTGLDTGPMPQFFHSRVTWAMSPNPSAEERPVFVFIPGGPGLSSRTLEPLNVLNKHFHIAFLDPPGVGGALPIPPDAVGNQYDWFIGDMARAVSTALKERNKNQFVLVGHSYGGVLASDMVVRFRQTFMRGAVGLVMMSSPMTYKTYSTFIDHREAINVSNTKYQRYKSRVMDWDPEKVKGRVGEVYKKRGLQIPSGGQMDAIVASLDRYNLVQWVLQHGRLIWNERDRHLVQYLLREELNQCYPELVRRVQKPWRQDQRAGDLTLHALAALEDFRIVSLIAEEDQLMDAQLLVAEARVMNAKRIMIPGGSHFAYIQYAKALSNTLAALFVPSRR